MGNTETTPERGASSIFGRTVGDAIIFVKEATNLTQRNSTSNPYCVVDAGGNKFKTATIKSNNPKWNETFRAKIHEPGTIKFLIFDEDFLTGDDLLGSYTFNPKSIDRNQHGHKVEFSWTLDKGENQRLNVDITYTQGHSRLAVRPDSLDVLVKLEPKKSSMSSSSSSFSEEKKKKIDEPKKTETTQTKHLTSSSSSSSSGEREKRKKREAEEATKKKAEAEFRLFVQLEAQRKAKEKDAEKVPDKPENTQKKIEQKEVEPIEQPKKVELDDAKLSSSTSFSSSDEEREDA